MRNKRLDSMIDALPEEKLEDLYYRSERDTNLSYTMEQAADLLNRRAARNIEKTLGLVRHETKRHTARGLGHLRDALTEFDMASIRIDAAIFKDAEERGETGVAAYDRVRRNANEILRLVQIYCDRAQDPETAAKINDYILSFPGHGTFSEEEFGIRMYEEPAEPEQDPEQKTRRTEL